MIEVVTEARLASAGDAIARAPDGRVIFVSGAAPSERVRIEIAQESKRFLRGRVVAVLEPSAARVEPRCKHYGACGGCVLQHVAHETQVANKTSELLETLRRVGGVVPQVVDPSWSGASYGYRTRARWAVLGRRFGYRKGASNEIVDIEECPILDPALERLIAPVRAALDRSSREEELAVDRDGVHVSPRLIAENPRFSTLPGVTTEPAVFEQANATGNEAMIAHVAELASAFRGEVLELYSGSGNFTRVLPGKVAAVEGSKEAVARAQVNLQHVTLYAEGVEAAVARFAAEGRRFENVVADPPRSGMSAGLPQRIAALGARRLIMISCDPATFSRDAGAFSRAGLVLSRVRLFDLYPQTGHAEVVGWFTA